MLQVSQELFDTLSPETQKALLESMVTSGNGSATVAHTDNGSISGDRFKIDASKPDGDRLVRTRSFKWLNTAENKSQYHMSRSYRTDTFNKILRFNGWKYERSDNFLLVWGNANRKEVITTSIGQYDRGSKTFAQSTATFYNQLNSVPSKLQGVAKKARQRSANSSS